MSARYLVDGMNGDAGRLDVVQVRKWHRDSPLACRTCAALTSFCVHCGGSGLELDAIAAGQTRGKTAAQLAEYTRRLQAMSTGRWEAGPVEDGRWMVTRDGLYVHLTGWREASRAILSAHQAVMSGDSTLCTEA